MAKKTKKTKKSTVRHTRAVQRDRSKRPNLAPPDERIEQRLTEILAPAIKAQESRYKELGLRNRTLTLSVMVAIVISIIWRQIGSGGTEAARLLTLEGLLWVSRVTIRQQAISERLRIFPSELFLNILIHILPKLRERWTNRKRPLPKILAWAQERYTVVLAADGSTLDALVRKVGLLRDSETFPLAGKMMALLDICSWLPYDLWYDPEAKAHDQRFWPDILSAIPKGALLLLDLGFTNFAVFKQMTHFTFITRAKVNLSFQVCYVNRLTPNVRDMLGWIGTGETRQLVRLIKIRYQGVWRSYLTNELNPLLLPAECIVALYLQRWRIEDAFNIVKRLLGLAYFWNGSQQGIQIQIWATWILYAILVDLVDDVAEALDRPFTDISIEMVYRSLYFFAQAYQRGEADDPIAYLVDNADILGIVKQRPKRSTTEFLYLTNPSGP
jgi:hypothetical protein